MRGCDADEPAPHVLRADDIDAAGSAAAAGRSPSREPMAMSVGRASRAGGRRGWPEAGRRMVSRREAPPPFPTDGDGTMNTAIAVPGNTADTFLVHFFGGGLADERYVVERFKAHADGDIRPWPGEAPAKGKGRRAKRVTATLKAVKEMRPTRTEIIICTGLRTRGGQQLWGVYAAGLLCDRKQRG